MFRMLSLASHTVDPAGIFVFQGAWCSGQTNLKFVEVTPVLSVVFVRSSYHFVSESAGI